MESELEIWNMKGLGAHSVGRNHLSGADRSSYGAMDKFGELVVYLAPAPPERGRADVDNVIQMARA